jgi:hypothetical protein
MEPVVVIGLMIVTVLGLGLVALLVRRRVTGYRRAYRRFERYYFPGGAPPILGRTAVIPDTDAALRPTSNPTSPRTPSCSPPSRRPLRTNRS